MNAARPLPASDRPSFLRVYSPSDEPADVATAHTTPSRVRKPKSGRKSKERQGDLLGSIDSEAYALAEALSRQFEARTMTAEEAAAHATQSTLRTYWRDVMKGEKKRARNTLSNYENALSLWERHAPVVDRPKWKGWPIGLINAGVLDAFILAAVQATSAENVRSRSKHLRVILNHAADHGVIPRAPKAGPIPMTNKPAAIFSAEQLASAYGVLKGNGPLQVAFVVAVNAGLRPVDLFRLRWVDYDSQARTLNFTSEKTDKPQTIPLAAVTCRHIERLKQWSGVSGYMFHSITDPFADDPERSRQGRARNRGFKQALSIAGINFAKPWQACRATCNERLESVREGSGQFVLGHGCTLNSKSYREPSQLIYEAVNSVPQPPCFSDF